MTDVAPGARCPTCDRRVPKPKREDSPATKYVRAVLPNERADALSEAFDALQAYVGADIKSYPRGTLMEALVIMAGQRREELKAWFEGRDEPHA